MGNELLDTLRACRTEHMFTCLPISHIPVYVAVDRADKVALVVESLTPVHSQHLSTDLLTLRLGVRAEVCIGHSTLRDGWFHILQCETTDPSIVNVFLALSQVVASSIDSLASASEILVQFFDSLAQLFRISPSPNLERERQGLWAELFLMKWTGDTAGFLQFWHNEPTRKFDFSRGPFRLEVKSTIKPERVHRFSHEQLFTPAGVEVMVASMMLRSEDAGLSLRVLIDEAREAVCSDVGLMVKLEKAIRHAGMANQEEPGPIFGVEDALAKLAWFRAVDVPRFESPEPPGVSNARYDVDLTTVTQTSEADLRLWLDHWVSSPGSSSV